MGSTIGTSNVSFKRWIAANDELCLRFDPRFNASGGEDKDFFSSAHRGSKDCCSSYPIVHDSTGNKDANLWNKAHVSSIMHRNRIVRLRKEVNFFAALTRAIWGVRFGLKSLPLFIDYQASLLFKNLIVRCRSKFPHIGIFRR